MERGGRRRRIFQIKEGMLNCIQAVFQWKMFSQYSIVILYCVTIVLVDDLM